MQERGRLESVRVEGQHLVERMKELLHAGNVRRVRISHEGEPVVEFPLTLGVAGAVLAPQLAAVGAVAALLTHCTIEVERADNEEAGANVSDPTAALPDAGSAGEQGHSLPSH